jgi:hypothetical protein
MNCSLLDFIDERLYEKPIYKLKSGEIHHVYLETNGDEINAINKK